ncbi:MAG: hypothetical protein RLZZ01_1302 [Actinomycetota bacterium]
MNDRKIPDEAMQIVLTLVGDVRRSLEAVEVAPTWDDPTWQFYGDLGAYEILNESRADMRLAIVTENLDLWNQALAEFFTLIQTEVGVKEKWAAFSAVSNLTWAASRHAFKLEIRNDVDEFLDELFG